MSKYTTEVRYICEQKSGFGNSGFADVDQVVAASWDKVFTTKAQLFDPAYKPVICQKILKHYYTQEIGAETVGLWMLWMNTRFEECVGYYNELYKTEQLEYNPLYDTDITIKRDTASGQDETTSGTRTVDEKENGSGERTDKRIMEGSGNSTDTSDANAHTLTKGVTTSSIASTNLHWDKYADTPQGGLNGIESGNYLTNVRNTTDADKRGESDEEDTDTTDTSHGSISRESTAHEDESKGAQFSDKRDRNLMDDTTGTRELKSTEDYLEKVTGKRGGQSYARMVMEYREALINIDLKFIEEFSDLFIGLW